TFTGSAFGSLEGFVDLDEVTPLKAALPRLAGLPKPEAARELRTILERVRLLGLARGLRGVEQTPETSFVLGAALAAYPQAMAVHVVRDGRDVVCSLLERGWFRASRGDADDAGHAYGAQPRFWVEPERRDEFARVSEARRAAWAWRRYVEAASRAPLELRYETLRDGAVQLAGALEVPAAGLARAFAGFHGESIGGGRDAPGPRVRLNGGRALPDRRDRLGLGRGDPPRAARGGVPDVVGGARDARRRGDRARAGPLPRCARVAAAPGGRAVDAGREAAGRSRRVPRADGSRARLRRGDARAVVERPLARARDRRGPA